MAERTFHFHGANVTFNDIHDLTGCTIYTGHAQDITPQVEAEPAEPAAPTLCTYIIPNGIKSAEEIEQEMLAAARKNAPALANYIKHALRLGLIDLRGDNGKQVYEMLKSHFGFTFSYKTWIAYY